MYKIGPLYRLVAYDAVCTNGTDGLYFVAITQFCVVVFAMIMVTLRFAFKPEVNNVQSTDEHIGSASPDDTGIDASPDDTGNNVSPDDTGNDALIQVLEEATGSPQLSDGEDILCMKDTAEGDEVRNE